MKKNRVFLGLFGVSLLCGMTGCQSASGTNSKDGAVPEIASSLISEFNDNFEGADGNGNLYWWNDASWSPAKLKRIAYGESESPSPSCGAYYAKAISSGEASQIQICHSNIAAALSSGTKYVYTYWAKSDTPGTLKLNVNGAASDWSAVCSTQGFPESQLGSEWKKYTGSFVLDDVKDQVQFQFVGTEGMTYYLDDFRIEEAAGQKKSIEKDIPSFKDIVASRNGIGKNVIAGTAVTTGEASDQLYMDLMGKHFNAVTLGNELKLDCMMGYHDGNRTNPGLTKAVLNGQEIVVPVLDHSRADAILDKILEMNRQNKGNQIKVRGHVLVWHSQAPEWFFHKDYVASKPYVSKDEMNIRLEWYIKEMMDYYTNPATETGKKYGSLFYAWDVVNEAISDATGTYRTDTEAGNDSLTDSTHGSKSSWWRVYKSNEFIINAFRFANKYAPASLELYYNDYNECSPKKCQGIVELLKAVKAAEGTRISGMGMQGHYDMVSPSISQFEDAVRAYCAVVGKVMLTELDMKGVKDDTKCAYRYKDLYEKLIALNKEPGINIGGIVFWGSVDKYSWLQSSSNVGGGADGSTRQRPLLFDDNFKAKPAYYAFVDPSKLAPYTQKVVILQSEDGSLSNAESYSFEKNGTAVSFKTVWNNKGITFDADVKTKNKAGIDSLTFVADKQQVSVSKNDFTETKDGYTVKATVPAQNPACGQVKILDIKVSGSKGSFAMSDIFTAEGYVKPFMTIPKGTVTVDGQMDSAWGKTDYVPLTILLNASVSAKAKLLWDSENLYVYAEVTDAVLNDANKEEYQQDSLEVFIDENNAKTETYEADDKQYRISFNNRLSFNGTKCTASNMKSAAKITSNGYAIEASFKWTDIKPAAGTSIGLDLQINDADKSGSRKGTLNWFDETGTGYMKPQSLGTALLSN